MPDEPKLEPDDFEWGIQHTDESAASDTAPIRPDGGTQQSDNNTIHEILEAELPDFDLPEVTRPRLAAIGMSFILLMSMSLALSGGAAAHTTFQASDETVITESGNLKSVTIAPAGDIHWNGLEQNASDIRIVVETKNENTQYEEVINDTIGGTSSLEGSKNYSLNTVDLIQSTNMDKTDFRASDGNTKNTTVDVRITMTLVGAGAGGSDVTDTSTASFVVSVENEPAGGNIGGQANTNAN